MVFIGILSRGFYFTVCGCNMELFLSIAVARSGLQPVIDIAE